MGPASDRPLIFGIGLGKTGTSSLHRALTILGFRSVHNGGAPIRDGVQRAIDEGAPLLSYLEPELDAFSDIPLLSQRFQRLDEQYPGSRFILTTRPRDDWLDSRRRHVQRNIAMKKAGQYDGTLIEVEEPKWTKHWDQHTASVLSYFSGRADFLEMDIAAAPSWGPLCKLLARPTPPKPFPWANRDEDRQATECPPHDV